jgi:phosphoglycerate dehydrogenase-like enzyme
MSSRIVMAMTDLPFKGEYWSRLEAIIAPDRLIAVDPKDDRGIAEALQQAEIAILPADLDDRHVAAPKLKWVHANHAGMTNSARPDVFKKGLIVTGAAGRSAPALAEHAMLFMLALCSNYPGFYEAQKRHQWGGIPGQANLRALYGRTVGIIGMGFTGMELATRCKAFGMHVLGYRRRDQPAPPGVDRMYAADKGEGIDEILRESDIIAMVINLSDKTRHMIGVNEFARMKSSAIIINLARGPVIDEKAMLGALRSGQIAGAGLDVFDQEPLPPDNPLWDAPNTLITPHSSAPVSDRLERTLAILAENFRRYRAGEPMLNRISEEDIYTAAD